MTLKRLILLIAVTLMAVPALAQYEDEIVWLKKRSAEFDPGEIQKAIFTPDEKSIIVSGTIGCFELDAMTGEVKREISNLKGVYKFSDDGQYVYTYDFKKVNWETGEVVKDYPVPNKQYYDFDINEKAGLLIVTSLHEKNIHWVPGGITVYDLNTAEKIKEVGIERNYYNFIEIAENGKFFVVGSEYDPDVTKQGDEQMLEMVWDTKTLDTMFTKNDLGVIKVSPDDKMIASANNSFVRIYDAKDWQKIYEWEPHKNAGDNSALAFTNNSRYLASAGRSTSEVINISIWDLKTGDLSYRYHNENTIYVGSRSMSFSKDDKYLLTFSSGRVVLFRSILTGIKEDSMNKIDQLYPNPTTEEIFLSSSIITPGQLHIDLTDIQGNIIKNLFEGKYDGGGIKFNISDAPSGAYFLKATQDGKTSTYKVIKER